MEGGAAGAADQQGVRAGPVRIVARDDLERSRLTVFFRLLLAIPHFLFLAAWTALMVPVAVANWVVVLVRARPVASGLIARYVRYLTHVGGYVNLAADPFPGFSGREDGYPIDLELAEPGRQGRWKAAFRLLLAIPAILLAFAFASVGAWYATDGTTEQAGAWVGIIVVAAFLGWFVSLARGRMAQGLRDLIAYGVGYVAQVVAYLLLLSDRYPSSDPLLPRYAQPAPGHPIRISVADDLRRSRLTVFFRLLLALPHMLWLVGWGLVALLALIANWFVAVLAGRPAEALRRFLAAYLRYATHVTAFVYLIANPFPGFTGAQGGYPIDLRIAPRARQSRWKTALRLILALPALAVAGTLGNALVLVAVFGWFAGLFAGRMPQGLRNLGAFVVRYNAQTWGYLLLLTDRYPFGGPSLELEPEAAPGPQPT